MCSILDRAPWDALDAPPPRDELHELDDRAEVDEVDEVDEAALGELFTELDGLWPPPGVVEDTAPGPYLAAWWTRRTCPLSTRPGWSRSPPARRGSPPGPRRGRARPPRR
jgi:hypothetical protein